jgi:7-carboxy-7-deazaguanine synthase
MRPKIPEPPILATTIHPEPILQVAETFYSIQGESSFAGYPCFFIRLAGCNLRCAWCDSSYSYEEPATPMALNQLLNQAAAFPNGLVEITGGEPLLQDNVYQLIDGLLSVGRKVLLETNGSISLARLDPRVVKIMDVKCPDSTMHDRMHRDNFRYLTPIDEVKFVIASAADYRWAKEMLATLRQYSKAQVLFAPVGGRVAGSDLAAWILADQLDVRLQLQLHRLLWPHEERGV